MIGAIITGVALALLLGGVLAGIVLGAPYLRTLKPQTAAALKLLKLGPGQTVLDLGSGDGSFLLAAAKQGIRGIGYEINPLLVLWSKIKLWRYRKLARVEWKNFWTTEWPQVDGIYVFLITRYMKKLDQKLCEQLSKPTPIASFTFKLPDREVTKAEKGVYLYYWDGC